MGARAYLVQAGKGQHPRAAPPALGYAAAMRRAAFIVPFLAAATAHAQPSAAPVEVAPLAQPAQPPAEDVVTSYRASTATADLISLGVILGGFSMDGSHVHDASDAVITTGLLGAFIASPVIHASRGHLARALGSFAMRGWIAGTGAVIGAATAECSSAQWFCGADRVAPGMVAGLAVAMLIDQVWLTDERAPRRRAATAAWTPIVAPRTGGGTVGVAASW
jgi:hypothetical protein